MEQRERMKEPALLGYYNKEVRITKVLRGQIELAFLIINSNLGFLHDLVQIWPLCGWDSSQVNLVFKKFLRDSTRVEEFSLHLIFPVIHIVPVHCQE